jgi:superfamily II DNA helicase RecQ
MLLTGAAVARCVGVPAAAGLVVVVSPLLALMRDQLQQLPQGLPGAMLQGSMSRQEVEQVGGGQQASHGIHVAAKGLCMHRLTSTP